MTTTGTPAPRIAVILNPTAGRGAAGKALPEIRRRLSEKFHGDQVIYLLTRERGDGENLAIQAIETGATLITAAGGDGTLHEVANALLAANDDRLALGLIPFGTGNDFARAVGLRGDIGHMIEALTAGRPHPIDIGIIEGAELNGPRFFLVAAGVGFVADTAATVNAGVRGLAGPAAYIYGAVKTLRRFTPIDVSLSVDDGPVRKLRAMLISVSNVATTGAGIQIAPGAVPDDGELDVCIVSGMPRLRLLGKLPAAFAGKHVGDPAVTMLRAKRLTIATDIPSRLWIDGEVIGATPAQFRLIPGALRMMLPSSYKPRREA